MIDICFALPLVLHAVSVLNTLFIMYLSILLLIYINYINSDFRVKHPMLYFFFSLLSLFAFINCLSIFMLSLKNILFIVKGYFLNVGTNSNSRDSFGSSSNNSSNNNGGNHNNNNCSDINQDKQKKKRERDLIHKKKYYEKNKSAHIEYERYRKKRNKGDKSAEK